MPACVVLLAEHLDRVLATGEDLLGKAFDARATCAAGIHVTDTFPRLSEFVGDLQSHELALAMRVMTARERADELGEADGRFDAIIKLFQSGTLPMVDAHAKLTAPLGDGVRTTRCATTYLKERAVIARQDSGPCGYSLLEVGETFLVAGAVELGALLDLVAAFLDAIEIHYEVFPESHRLPLARDPAPLLLSHEL
ncbi:MAG: hypothetical protein AAFQ45_03835 [Pseudomonadota bacterium]